jgi:hypothetical protein
MMGNKPGALGLYAALLLWATLMLPWLRRQAWFTPLGDVARAGQVSIGWPSKAALSLLVLLLVSNAWMVGLWLVCLLVLAALAYASLARADHLQAWLGFIVGAVVSLSLPWWMRTERLWGGLPIWQGLVCVLILVGVAHALTRIRAAGSPFWRVRDDVMAAAPALLLGALMLVSTGMASTQPIITAWHHWGAYVGPAQMVMAGVVPLHDIPLQYGLGPTLLLTALGHQGAWLALYVAAVVSTLLMAGVLCVLVLRLSRPAPWWSRALMCLVVVWSVVAWTAFPSSLMASLATPSTTGLRFAPGVLMLATTAWLQWRMAQGRGSPAWLGHMVWLLCVCWSPEAGVQASVVWLPGFFWSQAVGPEGWRWRLALRAAGQLTLALCIGLSCFVALFWARWRQLPLPAEYVAYLLHPPGPLPVSWRASLRFALVAGACWVWVMSRPAPADADQGTLRGAWLAGLLALATFTYYLGRSHDNNILNLAPDLVLLLAAAFRLAPVGSFVYHLTVVMLASLIAWTGCFGFGNVAQAWREGRLLEVDPQALVSSFDRQSPHSQRYLAPDAIALGLTPNDAARAVQAIRRDRRESLEVFDAHMVVDQGELLPPWNALHGPENFVYIPPEDRRLYLARVARRLQAPGWVLFDQQTDMRGYLADYDSVYRRTETLQFGTYTAIRFAP